MERTRNKLDGCVFCGDNISEAAFMESENFWVIYNHAPILPGHSLVIPKSHIESLLDLNANEVNEFVQLSLEAAKIILKVFKADSFNWTVQEKPAAGQTISHLHLHIFPRHDKDLPNPGDWYPLLKNAEMNEYIDSNKRQKLSRKQVVDIVKAIKKHIQS